MSKAIIKEVKYERASVGCIGPAGRILLDLRAGSSILTTLLEEADGGREAIPETIEFVQSTIDY